MKATVPLGVAATTLAGAILVARRGPDDIRGEVAVVTGASRGLGLLLAHELARHSCPLVICARDPPAHDSDSCHHRGQRGNRPATARLFGERGARVGLIARGEFDQKAHPRSS